jgi:uncharacterized protein
MSVTVGNRVTAVSVERLMALMLSGPFDTGTLPRIAADPVTVTVARRVTPGFEAQFLAWADELIAAVDAAPGSLGAAVFHPGAEGGEYQIVVRFVDGLQLRQWERSPVREELMARADGFVTSTRMQRTVGVEEWFEAASHAATKRSWWHTVLVDVAWVYPVSLSMALFVAPLLVDWALIARVAFGATLVTLSMTFGMVPIRRRLRARRRF